MHEMSYVIRFVNLAAESILQEYQEEKNAPAVISISVEVGEMSNVLPEYLQKYYPRVVKGTILEGSKLLTIPVAARILCEDCGNEYHPEKEHEYLCPRCKSARGKILSGRGVTLSEIVLEEDEPKLRNQS